MAMDKIRKNEEYDALNRWRQDISKYAGSCEGDPTVDAILAYERAKAAAKKSAAESEDVMGNN